MTRTQAKKIANDIMVSYLEPRWYMDEEKMKLSLRGVQIRNSMTTAILNAVRTHIPKKRSRK